MGNTDSTQDGSILTMGIKRAQGTAKPIYQLVDFTGGGELLQWVKYAIKSGDYSILDGFIEVKVNKFLYNNGKGKLIPVSELVKQRNQERNATLSALRKKKGKGKSGPNILEDINQDQMQGDMMKALKFLDGGGKGKGGSKYRDLCWDIEQRGVYGETVLNVCLLNGNRMCNELTKRLLLTFPKLVNDIFLSEDYYGMAPLHQAIVNEDPRMVRYLIGQGADVHQRCVGAFFCPDDQRTTREDSMEHEWVEVNMSTNYGGRTYWGEYPLSFAACLRTEDCFRLLRAARADPNKQDTNGNTVLHLTVIHNIPEMFDLAHSLGAKLHLKNKQDLTPLMLAARLARKQMFDHILQIESDVDWTYGHARSAAYPLQYIDTIDESSGKINDTSALGLIVYGSTKEHLDLLDGLMESLLNEKWKAFAKSKLLRNFGLYLFYYAAFFISFLLRPISEKAMNLGMNEADIINYNDSALLSNSSRCFLLRLDTTEAKVRIIAESVTVVGVFAYIFVTLQNLNMLGRKLYLKRMSQFPAQTVFTVSFLCVLAMIPFRLFCVSPVENIIAIVAMLTTSTYFLFFCRTYRL